MRLNDLLTKFSDEAVGGIDAEDQLIVDLEGFEGPLDLLLALARTRKLDLGQVSMLELARQYLAFIEEAETLRLELAADYLVMAAWLAYLKSRLLLPKDDHPADEPAGEALAVALAFRLQRLQAMRQATQMLMRRPRLGQDVFERGMAEPRTLVVEPRWSADLHDLVAAYAARRRRMAPPVAYVLPQRQVWSIKQAREQLVAWMGLTGDWQRLDVHLRRWFHDPQQRRTVLASSFGAILEMAREGHIDIVQDRPFGPIHLRPRPRAPLPLGGP